MLKNFLGLSEEPNTEEAPYTPAYTPELDTLSRRIPHIETLRELIFYIGAPFVSEDSTIADIGASYGDSVAAFYNAMPEDINYLLIDEDTDALESCLERFYHDRRIDCVSTDLTRSYPAYTASLTLLVDTLQYLPVNKRLVTLRSAWNNTQPGGALILVEPVKGSEDLASLYEGYNATKIDGYDFAQTGKPLTFWTNQHMLKSAGFSLVDCFWRNLNYAAWIAVRDE